jgi:CubicO group peptidase (beta-lactamase class C family)
MSQASAADRLNELLAPFAADKPGLAALVTVGGDAVFERYLGGADLEHGVPVTASTRFHVASVSKQFTAFASLGVATPGRVDLAADIHAYLPELADYRATVTVSDLVHHTSGLRDQWELMMLSGTPLDGLIRQSAILAMAASQRGLNFPPGTAFRYSNTGYTLLAEIVERTSGTRFPRYLEQQVFIPLGMTETLVYGDAAHLVPGRAMSYRFNRNGEVRQARLNYSNYGATSLQSTPRDLAKWARELMHPAVFGAKLIATMTAPGALRDGAPLSYGFGIVRDTIGGRRALNHDGGDAGYRAFFTCFPDDDASVIVCANGQADTGAIGRALADAFLTPAPSPPAALPPDAAALDALAGDYVNDWGPGITLKATDGKLMMHGRGPAVEVKFLPDGDFYPYTPAYAFSPRSEGVLAEGQGVGGSPLLHRRAERVKPSPESLAALAGTYRCDEIDSTYRLAPGEGGLRLSCLRFAPLTLVPADADAFDGPFMRLELTRDGGGAPSGFTVATGRVRGLAFRKIGDIAP